MELNEIVLKKHLFSFVFLELLLFSPTNVLPSVTFLTPVELYLNFTSVREKRTRHHSLAWCCESPYLGNPYLGFLWPCLVSPSPMNPAQGYLLELRGEVWG